MGSPRRTLTPPRWLHPPRRTARMRLALVYSLLFLASGACLLTITNLLVRSATQTAVIYRESNGAIVTGSSSSATTLQPPANLPPQVRSQVQQIQAQATRQRDSDLQQLLVGSGIALAIMTLGSVAFGWLIAGRVLRPVRTITTTAQRISASNLHERLALQGPEDEFKELGDTLDGLLARLESSFEAHRHFVANASHELRTPVTVGRTLIQVALADPWASAGTLRSTCEEVLASIEQQERLIEALLTLTTSEQGLEHRELVDLAHLADEVLRAPRTEAVSRGLRVQTAIAAAPIMGDSHLIQRLVANLVDNAVRHNERGGWVDVQTGTLGGRAVLSVRNGGQRVEAVELEKLFQPFQRPSRSRASHQNGHGFGLSIVGAIARAHGATVSASSPPEGGLAVQVRFPAIASSGSGIE